MPRWNGKIETGGTAPPLREFARNPTAVAKRAAASSRAEVRLFARRRRVAARQPGSPTSRSRTVTAAVSCEALEAADVRELLSTDEKEQEGAGQSG